MEKSPAERRQALNIAISRRLSERLSLVGRMYSFDSDGEADWLLLTHVLGLPVESGDLPPGVPGLLPYADANGWVLETLENPGFRRPPIPLLAAVYAADQFRRMETHLSRLARAGCAGVQNFPSIGLMDGNFRKLLEESGLGYDREVDMIGKAAKMGLFTAPVVFDPAQAAAMAKAGCDMLIVHPGLDEDGDLAQWNATGGKELLRLVFDTVNGFRPGLPLVLYGKGQKGEVDLRPAVGMQL